MASHEFRTPLTGVLTSAELLADYAQGPHKDKQLKHVDRIRSSVKHLNDILEDFLSVGRIEEGRAKWAKWTGGGRNSISATARGALLSPRQVRGRYLLT